MLSFNRTRTRTVGLGGEERTDSLAGRDGPHPQGCNAVEDPGRQARVAARRGGARGERRPARLKRSRLCNRVMVAGRDEISALSPEPAI
jgi:hypothetical protein